MARWDVEQVAQVEATMEREFTAAIADRGIQHWPIELRIFCTAIPIIYREHLDDPADDAAAIAELQTLVFQPLVDKAARHEAFRFSPEARVDFGTDVSALIRGRCRTYRSKLLADLRKQKMLPASKMQFDAVAFAAAQYIFATPADKAEKASVFRNRMPAFIELCTTIITRPTQER